jgi:hypothetical protein
MFEVVGITLTEFIDLFIRSLGIAFILTAVVFLTAVFLAKIDK